MTGDEHERRTQRGAGLRVAHFFADHGVESEALAAVGDVHRFTIDPRPSPFNASVTEIDLGASDPDVDQPFDLGLFQPPCYRWTQRADEDAPRTIVRPLLDGYQWVPSHQASLTEVGP